MSSPPLHGLVVEFDRPERILRATRQAWEAGYREMDAYAPYPVEGLAAALGMKRSRIPSVVFCGAMVGAGVGFLMQYYSMVSDYPFNAGGRPLNSWPAFVIVAFEMLILIASLSAFIGMLFLNGLPRPNHPIFNTPGFERASQDRFFLCIEATDPRFARDETSRFLAALTDEGRVIDVFDEQLVEQDVRNEDAEPRLVPEPRVPATQAGER